MTAVKHPPWCDLDLCTTPRTIGLGAPRGGAHRSAVVRFDRRTEFRGTSYALGAQLQQAAMPLDADTFLVLLAGREDLVIIPVQEAGPLATLITEGLDAQESAGDQ